jgi:hypothetical protein
MTYKYTLKGSQFFVNDKPVRNSFVLTILQGNIEQQELLEEQNKKLIEENAELHKEKMKYKRRLEINEELKKLDFIEGH